jgi:putative addiction module component (TIGR02574 family)
MVTEKARQLLIEALTLPERSRIELAASLLESTTPTADGVEAAWTAELRRRIAQLDAGNVEGSPWRDVLGTLEAKVRRHGRRSRQ